MQKYDFYIKIQNKTNYFTNIANFELNLNLYIGTAFQVVLISDQQLCF